MNLTKFWEGLRLPIRNGSLKLGTHYPCPRAVVATAPWTRAGPWTRVYKMTPVFTARKHDAVDNTACGHGQLCTEFLDSSETNVRVQKLSVLFGEMGFNTTKRKAT